jgi:hypothetical protein
MSNKHKATPRSVRHAHTHVNRLGNCNSQRVDAKSHNVRKIMSNKRKAAARLGYTVPALADALGEHPATIWRRIRKGEIKVTEVGQRKIIGAPELRRLGLIED